MASTASGTAYRHLRDLFAAGSVLGLEDGPLLARYSRSKDPAAFEALVSRHGPMVLATCRAVLKNEHDAEDAFQATFLVLAKRAGSVRESEALGGWLHRVAYHASLRASLQARKRRRIEAEGAKACRDNSRTPSDLATLLHEEIDRLPESQRLSVVLRDLEGLSYEEAAERLGWTVPRFRHRLANARRRLKDRLGRRGAVAPAIVGASASVPPSLARATLGAATVGPASSGATLLTHILLRGMFMTRLKLLTPVAITAMALTSAALIAAAGGRPVDEPGPALQPRAGERATTPEPSVEGPDGLVAIRGIVVDPLGRPVAGAKVWASIPEPAREASTGPDGRFLLKVPPPDPRLPDRVNASYPRLVASAPGFGLGFLKEDLEAIAKGTSTIRLVEDNPPIEGKIIDLEGRAVAGARVQARVAWVASRQSSFEEWARRAKEQVANSHKSVLFGVSTPIEAETGGDGRFTMTGIGRDRVVSLLVTGPTIASTQIEVMTSDGPEIRVNPAPVSTRNSPFRPEVFHARKFEAVAGPTRPIEGVIVDKDTGRGIEGLTVRAAVLNPRGQSQFGNDARTDDEGRYRLLGLPAEPAYRVSIDQTPGQTLPYVGVTSRTPAGSPIVGPVRFDFALKRGVVVRGRVTDKATGRPVTGSVDPFILPDNPAIAEFPDFFPRQVRHRTDLDGRFEVVTLPGRGLLAFRADRDEYVNALGFESLAGITPQGALIPTHRSYCVGNQYHALAGVDLDPKAESATVDLQVDSGRSVDLNVVDAEGRAVDGLKTIGMTPMIGDFEPQASSVVKVRAIDPSRPRRVSVYQLDRKLVGSIWLKGDEAGPLTVRMVPWGTIVGRFVDAEGNPVASQPVGQFSYSSNLLTIPRDEGLTGPNPVESPLRTGKDGRFRVEALVPGLRYSLSLGGIVEVPGAKDVVVAPGEVKDLGDIKSPPPKP